MKKRPKFPKAEMKTEQKAEKALEIQGQVTEAVKEAKAVKDYSSETQLESPKCRAWRQ